MKIAGLTKPNLENRTRMLWMALFLHATADACINSFDQQLPMLMSKGNPQQIAETLANQEQKYAKTASLETGNDLAVAKIFAGQYSAAVALLQTLEQRYPGNAKTAANLGTAFELAGNNDQALIWITKGIERDPGDHYGTEWLHLKYCRPKSRSRKIRIGFSTILFWA
jgi:Flp pilus assembly protein TadD